MGRIAGRSLFRFSTIVLLTLCVPGPARQAAAEEPARRSGSRRCLETADRFVSERLQVWQRRLRFEDWKFSIIMSPQTELKPNTVGNIHWNAAEKSAVIRILDISDYDLDCRDALKDMDFTIVHELLHLKVSLLPRCEATRKPEESAVNEIAGALMELDRAATFKDIP